MKTTIAAVASAQGRAAIAIIRVSGNKSLEVLRSITKKDKSFEPNHIKPTWIYKGNNKIDQSMAVYFKSPNSFTGEDMIEIHCHGSKVVQEQILDLLYELGVAPAKPGEFSERAYLNGKIDMNQAEAIMELVSAENVQLARIATRQLAGEFTKSIEDINKDVVSLSSAIAADLDFSEEDLPNVSKLDILEKLKNIIEKINLINANSEMITKLREGVHVSLLGLPNAGKSTLLNTLLGYERAIVTEIAGTTRDTISESVNIEGIDYHFTDTAGLNEKPDKIEKLGIKKTITSVKNSDIVLLLIEPGNEDKTYEYIKAIGLSKLLDDDRLIKIYSKSDIYKAPAKKDFINISSKDNSGITELINKISRHSKNISSSNLHILTKRQADIINRVYLKLVNLEDSLDSLTNDIIGSELEGAANDLNELSGKQVSQQVIDSMFRSFCIGK